MAAACLLGLDLGTTGSKALLLTAAGEVLAAPTVEYPLLPGFSAPKLLWVREHEPALYAQIAQVLLPKDYLRYRLTGAYATEVSDASGTALFDVAGRRWSSKMLAALDLPAGWLPPCTES